MGEWQPIETAPKDGTEVLCAWKDIGGYAVLAFFPEWEREDGTVGAWVLEGDWETKFAPDGVHNNPPCEYMDPTHWMPLPEPPKDES